MIAFSPANRHRNGTEDTCRHLRLQEQLLDLPAVESGRAGVTERKLRQIVAELDWGVQRGMWRRLRHRNPLSG